MTDTTATERPPKAVGHVTLVLQEPPLNFPLVQTRVLGSLVVVEPAGHKTSGAVLVN